MTQTETLQKNDSYQKKYRAKRIVFKIVVYAVLIFFAVLFLIPFLFCSHYKKIRR